MSSHSTRSGATAIVTNIVKEPGGCDEASTNVSPFELSCLISALISRCKLLMRRLNAGI